MIARMLMIVTVTLLAMKVVVAVMSKVKLSFVQWSAFSLGWFGMRPVLFETLPSPAVPYKDLLIKAIVCMIAGVLMLYVSALLDFNLFLLIGLSLILHFGILNLSAVGWRMLGVNAPELFRAPYKSKSLTEFWGKRWNVAFSEMTVLVAYRPLKERFGADKARLVAFLFSGLLHEIAISVPVMTGFGLPMTYFAIHAIAMHLEAKSTFVQKITKHNVLSRVWVFSLLLLPLPLLFHAAFMEQVLIPLRALILSELGIGSFVAI